MSLPRQPQHGPQYVPADVAYSVFAMWASLILSAVFAIYEFVASTSVLDPMLRLAMFGGYVLTIKSLHQRKEWARYAAVVLTVVFYASLALDADGLTNPDLLHLMVKSPIDVFVISRLFKPTVTKWLHES